jgi:predicted RNase H-like nuclease
MGTTVNNTWLAGIDGCPVGWVAAFVRPAGDEVRVRIVPHFSAILDAPESPAAIAVDIPIGLPERSGRGGRAAENAVRPLLGARQSSVFSVPSRQAVYATSYGEACALGLATSDPPRKVSKQLFMLCRKIREVDEALRGAPVQVPRVFESHPEAAFWRMNDNHALDQPKKVKGRPFPGGLALRRTLLIKAGLPTAAVMQPPPRGAGPDDLLDALACAVTARRIHAGLAQPFPEPPPRDAFGLPMAIWA